MYRCEKCKNVIPKGIVQMNKVVETRKKQYYPRGRGWEIAREIKVCPDCYGE